ncbi:GFA family protein [Pseudomarimonas salicorniae]|uniref:GFA family protein n=1 Tax=Pseudomarimonas salicorniae TaxID=2933270 RepID=A0ABT0GG02_9GAMM|nr:GFA family protein [Lysobacter sp. CAU 1642]MCK7593467.1 GFA family protein [Lysobacter sp. CAU 1642]
MSAYLASCLCGAVAFEIHGGIDSIIHCHCSRCRKSSGTAFATNGFIASAGLRVLRGAERIAAFEMSPGRKRHFCATCASPLYSSNAADPERLRLRLGVLDSEISERPLSHNFVSSRACWEDLDADLPRYDAHEPGRSAPVGTTG